MKKGRSPRHAIKKLIKAGDGLSNPTPECTIEICYTGKLTGSGEIFDDAYAEGPNRSGARTMQFKDPSMPSGFWMVVETMREGEKAEAILHHKAAFGAEGNAALGVPPDTFIEYEVRLVKVYDIQEFEEGAIRRTILQLPKYVGRPEEGNEVDVRWKGDLIDADGNVTKQFQHKKKIKILLGPMRTATTIPGGVHVPLFMDAGVRQMGEGEIHEMIVGPSWAYGEEGNSKLGVPPNARVKVWMELVSYNTVEDISPSKNGTAIKRVLRRGAGEETPYKGDECTISYKFTSAATKAVLHERSEFFFVLGQFPERAATALRVFCNGAHADTLLTLLVHKMHKGEVVELRVKPEFGGGSEDMIADITLVKFNKVITCPNTDGKVRVTLVKDDVPYNVDERGPNRESSVTVRYKVRGADGTILDQSGKTPVTFTQGSRQVLPAIDEAVLQMRPKGRAIVQASGEWAYGGSGDDVEIEIELVTFKRFQAHYAMDLDEKMTVQARRKEEGNALFKKGQYEEVSRRHVPV